MYSGGSNRQISLLKINQLQRCEKTGFLNVAQTVARTSFRLPSSYWPFSRPALGSAHDPFPAEFLGLQRFHLAPAAFLLRLVGVGLAG